MSYENDENIPKSPETSLLPNLPGLDSLDARFGREEDPTRRFFEEEDIQEVEKQGVDPLGADSQDMQETLEVDMYEQAPGEGPYLNIEERIYVIEDSIRELSGQLSDVAEGLEELFKRLSVVMRDSQRSIKKTEKLGEHLKFLEIKFQDRILEGDDHSSLASIEEIEILDKKISELKLEQQSKLEQVENMFRSDVVSNIQKIHKHMSSLEDDLIKRIYTIEEQEQGIHKEEFEKLSNRLDQLKEDVNEKNEKTQNNLNNLKAIFLVNLETLSGEFRNFREDLNLRFAEIDTQIKDELDKKISFLESRLTEMNRVFDEQVENLNGEYNKRITNMNKEIDTTRTQLEELSDNRMPVLVEDIETLNKRIENISENFTLEIEVFSEQIKKEIQLAYKNEEDIRQVFQQLKQQEEVNLESDVAFEEITERVLELSNKLEAVIKYKINTLEDRLLKIQIGMEKEMDGRLKPVEEQIDKWKRILSMLKM
ncbi:MAG: hypothetical protein ACLFQV_00475 [Vulcanimicrobiota bacterium]